MNNEYEAIQEMIERARIERSVNISDKIVEFIVESIRLANVGLKKVNVAIEKLSPYLPRSQA